ncbi:3-dehydroquinate synthase [Mesobacillus harenae]|uniref:3-dehydroquinate synthase n=1 Tax=Mesobacillus harenae TaxID=2213203 RepID=UPI00158101DF|nr:3-dehydroquinate synthase [Mesobacillus harenae]
MDSVVITTDSHSYPVYIGEEAVKELNSFVDKKYTDLTSILIITDENVGKLYLDRLESVLQGKKISVKTVPAGERAKTFEVYFDCLSYALENKLDRKSLILSFGGGAVGDLGGFVAATYMRGIPFIQIPTTILAHDSAVGGKVAINHPLGKNMVGSFYQPDAVIYDLQFLKSLPDRERRSGFAEVIKHALIQDKSFYDWLLENISSLDHVTPEQQKFFLTKGIKIKGAIVSQDEREMGIRAYLNFGHTLGHAIEAEAGYGGISHGESVAVGMVFAIQLSQSMLGLSFDTAQFIGWLKTLGYSTDLPENMSVDRLVARMKQDKKSVAQMVRFVLLGKMGEPVLTEVPDKVIKNHLINFQKTGGM